LARTAVDGDNFQECSSPVVKVICV
jgi:hypothetical protein